MRPEILFITILAYLGATAAIGLMIGLDYFARALGDLDLPPQPDAVEVIE